MPGLAPYRHAVEVVWHTMQDDRVRPAHAPMHGQVQLAGPYGRMPKFEMDGRTAKYPGDPMLPSALRVNCRCWLDVGDPVEGSEITIGRPAVPEQQIEVVGGELAQIPVPNQWIVDLMSGPMLRDSIALDEMIDIGFPFKEIEKLAVQVFGRGTRVLIPNTRIGMSGDPTRPIITGARPEFSFGFNIVNEYGEILAEVQRYGTLKGGELWIDNMMFDVYSQFQGKGFGTLMLKHLDDWYRAMGVRGTTLYANIDVGGFAWARASYDWNPDGQDLTGILDLMDRVRDRFADKEAGQLWWQEMNARISLAKQQVPFDAARHASQEDWLAELFEYEGKYPDEAFPAPIDLAMAGWTPESTTATSWPGRDGMLGSSWHGRRFL